MNPNRQAAPDAEDGRMQPAAEAGGLAASKAAASTAGVGKSRKLSSVKAPAPKAQAAKLQGQGGKGQAQAGRPQGPAAALLDAERRRAAEHGAPAGRE